EEELLDQELLDLGDLETRQLLTVSLALAVPGLVLELENDDLRALLVPDDLCGDLDLRELRRVGGHLLPVNQKQRGQFDGIASVAGKSVDDDDVTNRNLLLAATGLD